MTRDKKWARRLAMALPVLVLGGAGLMATSGSAARAATPKTTTTPTVSHVFQILLENEEETTSFPNTGTELDKLAAAGVFVPKYYGTGHASLDNYIAMISGQAQFTSTSQDCGVYHNTGGTVDAKGFYQPVTPQDTGCVFPNTVLTLADQLSAAKKTWRGYMEDMGNTSTRETNPCGQPAVGGVAVDPTVGAADDTQAATAADQYAARHNPFVYFHSLIDPPASGPSKCAANVVPLTNLTADLAKTTFPAFTFITPNLCDDGHDHGCKGPGAEGANPGAGGLVSANAFLAHWIPIIQASAAYKNHGLILITFDEGTTTKSCCGESKFSTGGGQVGAILLFPGMHKHKSNCSYNHFAELRSWEDLFHLTPTNTGGIMGSDGKGHLAHAGDVGVPTFVKELAASASPC
jgi:hypothetical protein